ncbi:MAG: hypothetical protein AAFW83_06920 [Pseudomonadota bacterium]
MEQSQSEVQKVLSATTEPVITYIPQSISLSDWIMIGSTLTLALATIILALFTIGLYRQTKRANRPHVSISLDHASEMGACVLSVENHGPGVAFDIEAVLAKDYHSSNNVVLVKNSPDLKIPFLKPGKTHNIRIPGAGSLEPSENTASVNYNDVFKQKMYGSFNLATSTISRDDAKADESERLFWVAQEMTRAVSEPLSKLPGEIEALRREVAHASHMFRQIH